MGASFQIVTPDSEGVLTQVPDTEALPTDGGTWSYSTVASVLRAFGLAFDEEFCCDHLDPQVLVKERHMAILRVTTSARAGITQDDLILCERVQLVAEMAQAALAIPGATVSYS